MMYYTDTGNQHTILLLTKTYHGENLLVTYEAKAIYCLDAHFQCKTTPRRAIPSP